MRAQARFNAVQNRLTAEEYMRAQSDIQARQAKIHRSLLALFFTLYLAETPGYFLMVDQ